MTAHLQIKFNSCIDTENYIWFFNCNFNGLICVNKINGKIEKIVKIPGIPINAKYQYFSIFKLGNELIGIPNNSDKITSYNLKTNSFLNFSIRDYINIPSKLNFKAAYQYKNEIIMFPNRANKILIYNHIKGKISTVNVDNESLNTLYPNRTIQFRPQFEILNDCIFIPFVQAGAILIFNLSNKCAEIKIIDGLTGCDTINYYNGLFYLAAWNEKKIFAVDTNFHIRNIYTEFPNGLKNTNGIFAYSILIKEKIVYFPLFGNMVISFDLKDKTIKKEIQVNSITKTYMAKIKEDEILTLMQDDSWLVVFFYLEGVLHKRSYCTWNSIYNTKVIENYLVENNLFDIAGENGEVDLNLFVDIVKNIEKDNFLKERWKSLERIGERIYKYMVGEQK